jgi:hypothetical protein
LERSRQIERAPYKLVATDVALIALFIVVASTIKSSDVALVSPVCFMVLSFSNFLFLRRNLGTIGGTAAEEGAMSRSQRFSTYLCSIVFFVGTLYGVLMISQGNLPRAMLPVLLVPLSLAIYCLRTARRAGERR